MADIPIEFLQKIRRIEIQTIRLVEDMFAGKYKSIFRGRGMDFEEVREYQEGDDIRYIDWNVTARTDVAHIKVFREERELTVILAVDVSGSGDLGSAELSKRELMAQVAAVLAFSANRSNDKIGLLLFTSEVEHFVQPGKGRKHILRVIREILYFQPEHRGTDIERALRYTGNVLHRSSLIFFISDFLDDDFYQAVRITNQKFDLIPVICTDKRELELPKVGWVALEDAETGEIVEVNTDDPKVRREYEQRQAERLDTLKKTFIRSGIDVIDIRNGEEFVEPLQEFFIKRMLRRR